MDSFKTPDLIGFDDYRHVGGVPLPLIGLQEVQRDILEADPADLRLRNRRGYFTTLANPEVVESEEERPIREQLHRILLAATAQTVRQTQEVLGYGCEIDPGLSAVWIETGICPGNSVTHRDTNDPRKIRSTFSVSPTRALESGVVIPISDAEWRNLHFPMGSDQLHAPEFNQIPRPEGSLVYMAGTTYHRSPLAEELVADFTEIFPGMDLELRDKIPRVFGSIWGKII